MPFNVASGYAATALPRPLAKKTLRRKHMSDRIGQLFVGAAVVVAGILLALCVGVLLIL